MPQSDYTKGTLLQNVSKSKSGFLIQAVKSSVVWSKFKTCSADTRAVGEIKRVLRWGVIDTDFIQCLSVVCLSVLPCFSRATEKPFPRGALLSLDTYTATTLWSHCRKHMKDHSKTHTHAQRGVCVCNRDYFRHCICQCRLFLSLYCYQFPVDHKLCWHFTSFLAWNTSKDLLYSSRACFNSSPLCYHYFLLLHIFSLPSGII